MLGDLLGLVHHCRAHRKTSNGCLLEMWALVYLQRQACVWGHCLINENKPPPFIEHFFQELSACFALKLPFHLGKHTHCSHLTGKEIAQVHPASEWWSSDSKSSLSDPPFCKGCTTCLTTRPSDPCSCHQPCPLYSDPFRTKYGRVQRYQSPPVQVRSTNSKNPKECVYM